MKVRRNISKSVRFAVFARDQFTCCYCGRRADAVELHVDHVVPVSAGGTNEMTNLRTACIECNLGKGSMRGVTPPKAEGVTAIVGLCFHSFTEDGQIEWQGRISAYDKASDSYVCDLLSWVDGAASNVVIVPAATIGSFALYRSDYDMRRAYADHTGISASDFEDMETWLSVLSGRGAA